MAMVSPTFNMLSGHPDNFAVATQVPDPDRKIRIVQAVAYKDRLWYCIAAFIAFVAICHWLSVFYKTLRRVPPPSARSKASITRLPAATLNAFRALVFRQTLSIGESYTLNVAEVFLTSAYIVLTFTWSLVNSTNTKGLKFDPKYWANTAGNIAATQLPLMTALGMKNNIISFLTGVSFDKLNYLHRMTARVIVVLTWVHGAGRIKLGLSGDVAWTNPWMQCGILASTSLSILSIMAIQPVRNRHYEIFLLVHFILCFIFLLASYFHTEVLLGLGYYIWPTFLIWGLDRLARAIRLIAFNFGYFKPKRAVELDAHVDILSPHFLRIVLYRPAHFHWAPGQSAYLTIPAVSGFPLEAHPFTMSTIDVSHIDDERSSDGGEKDSEASTSPVPDQGVAVKKLVFLTRIRGGFTQRLLHAARDNQQFRAFLDGPYSSPPLLKGYSTVILIAGGSGVAFTLPLLLDLIHRSRVRKPEVHRVVFVWAVRDITHVEWISDALVPMLANIPSSISIDIRVFVTAGADNSWDDDSVEGDSENMGASKNKPKQTLLSSPFVNVWQGRPDVDELIKNEITQASGPISVNVCGTHALAKAVRSSLRYPRFMDVLRGGPTVTLHVEAFGNA